MAKRGRPKLTANTKLIETLASKGCTKAEISRIIGCADNTFDANFCPYYDKGRQNLKRKLREKQIYVAMKGNVAMLIWLGKQYLEQTDKQEMKQSVMRTYGPEEVGRLRKALQELRELPDDASAL
jgi:hypothetical protein